MITPDTNVIVRLLVGDDLAQSQRAQALFASDATIFLPTTVLMETEWVLRYAYEFSATAVVTALRNLCGLPNVELENGRVVAQALEWHEAGFDFADAVHLATAANVVDGEKFVTFDSKLIKKAAKIVQFPVEEVPTYFPKQR